MIATYPSSRYHLSAILPLLGTASAFIALLGVGFAIGGIAMMTVI